MASRNSFYPTDKYFLFAYLTKLLKIRIFLILLHEVAIGFWKICTIKTSLEIFAQIEIDRIQIGERVDHVIGPLLPNL